MTVKAWPFAIARGHRAGHRTLLAPGWLIAERSHGVLDDHVRPASEEHVPVVLDLETRTGRPLTIVHATHRLTAADLGASDDPYDEHGRPLGLLYGFVCARALIPSLHEDDLRTSLDQALATFREFFADEDGFTVAGSQAFPLRSPAEEPAAPVVPKKRRPVIGISAAAVALAAIVVFTATQCSGQNTPPPQIECPTGAATCTPTPTP